MILLAIAYRGSSEVVSNGEENEAS
jgi:hypothetical protein